MAIQELTEQLCNQIAAGEVIERPSSVIKELVENAIDAKSTQIEVQFQQAGLAFMTVIDNGEGIPASEVELAFHRHATSKIKDETDLFRIKTLGFRGEALPSIASVAKVTLQSTERGVTEGKEIVIEGGKVLEEKSAAARPGTKVTVENLFFNTPARLKHLKSERTEKSHILQLMHQFAFAHPEIQFRLVECFGDGKQKVLFRTAGNGKWDQIMGAIYGPAMMRQGFEIHAENYEFTMDCFLTLPSETRADKRNLVFVLNGRVVTNPALLRGVLAGYGKTLMIQRYPLGVLRIQTDPQLLDVNVHPTKKEVRFSKEERCAEFVEEKIARFLRQQEQIPTLSGEYRNQQAIQEAAKAIEEEWALPDDIHPKEERVEEAPVFSTPSWKEETLPLESDVEDDTEEVKEVNNESVKEAPVSSIKEKEEVVLSLPKMEYFGQLHGTYLFAQGEDGLYIIDQHAAQERIKYEYYRKAIVNWGQEKQQLMIPHMFTCSLAESYQLEERREILESVGLSLEPFGEGKWILREIPQWMQKEEANFIDELIFSVINGKDWTVEKLREDTAIMMSCKGSIKANYALSEAEARLLIEQLNECEEPYHCPHGRPVMVHLRPYDIERLFKRIQD